MTRSGTAYRPLVSHARPTDYALLVTGRVLPPALDPPVLPALDPPMPPEVRAITAVRSAPAYLPRWRSAAPRRRSRT